MTARRTWFASRASGLRQLHAEAHRVVACCVIILGHCEASLGVDPSPEGRLFQHALNVSAHYAVPFFFVLAGYSLAPKLGRPAACRHAAIYTRRILALFLGTSAVYIVFGAMIRGGLSEPFWTLLRREVYRLLRDPITLVLQGPAVHLWFLLALVVAVWTTVWFRRRARLRYLGGVALVFYAATLLAGPYGATLAGWPTLTRWSSTLLLGTPFVILGVLLRHVRTLPPVRVAFVLIVGGILCQAAEQYWLWSRWNVSPFAAGTLIGTALQTMGVSLLALQPGHSLLGRTLGRFGDLTLMAYLSHVAFLVVLRPYRFAFDRPMWRFVFPVAVTILSFSFAATYHALSKALRRYYKHGLANLNRETA